MNFITKIICLLIIGNNKKKNYYLNILTSKLQKINANKITKNNKIVSLLSTIILSNFSIILDLNLLRIFILHILHVSK